MTVALRKLPSYLILEPTSTVRIDMRLEEPSCEIDVSLDNPRPGRSFVLLIGAPGGPFVQRVRLAGRARIHFDPQKAGDYSLLLANPQSEPLVVRLKVTELASDGSLPTRKGRESSKGRGPRTRSRPAARTGRAPDTRRRRPAVH